MMSIPIPKQLKFRPTYKGFPIPYVNYTGETGEPDLKVLDHKKVAEVLADRLCGICGQKIKEEIAALIGGEKAIKNGLFTDPPMHRACARYAAQVCPYLNGERRQYSKAAPKHAGEPSMVVREYEDILPEGIPKRMGIYYTRTWQWGRLPGRGPMLFITAGPPLSVDWHIMPPSREI